MAVGKSFLDQYSVFCVFGSVVGCVVVPLITQSVESLIFSAIVISLTANRFSKKVVIEPSVKNETKEQKSIKGSKDIIPVCKKKKKPPSNNNNNSSSTAIQGNQNALYHQLSPSQLRKQYQEEVERREYEKLREMERKEEEKREKKLKKKEERLKRKNNEKKETEVKQSVPKEKVSTSDKVVSTTRTNATPFSPKSDESKIRERSTAPSSSTPHAHSPSNGSSNMNSRKNKYEHYRPNIPRFARAAAKQRQLVYQQQSGAATNWNTRSSPSPDTVIQPKVQSVIGCRNLSPEPRDNGSTPSPVPEEKEQSAGCYTLFGEYQDTKNLVSLIRMEAGLESSSP